MENELSKLALGNFARGAANELFEREINAIIENIDDINTSPIAKRKITMTFTIEPDLSRETAKLSVDAKSTLAPVKGAIGMTYFGRTNGKLNAYHHNINQLEMDVEQAPTIVSDKQA